MHNKKLAGITAVIAFLALLIGWTLAGSAGAAEVRSTTRVVSFNAGPEPIVAGDNLTISGKLERKASTWLPVVNVPVQIQRKLPGKYYAPYKSTTTNGLGVVKLVVPVSVSASYRMFYAGNTKLLPTASTGDNVQLAPKSITAVTKVVNWPDTDTAGGIWAKDHFSRTVTVTRGAKVPAGYTYSFVLTDVGGFVSGKNVPSPNAPAVNLHGVVRGSFDGGLSGSFVANTRYLSAANVPATEDGADGKVASSSEWGKLALPTGVVVHSWDASATYSWVYEAPGTCETFTQANDGNVGNLLGLNNCD